MYSKESILKINQDMELPDSEIEDCFYMSTKIVYDCYADENEYYTRVIDKEFDTLEDAKRYFLEHENFSDFDDNNCWCVVFDKFGNQVWDYDLFKQSW